MKFGMHFSVQGWHITSLSIRETIVRPLSVSLSAHLFISRGNGKSVTESCPGLYTQECKLSRVRLPFRGFHDKSGREGWLIMSSCSLITASGKKDGYNK